METLQFSILINAVKPKVWNVMLGADTYREWAKEFHAGSDFEGSWEQGSEIRFSAPDENGKAMGMQSRIKENILHQYIAIEHIAVLQNGTADSTSEEARKWVPSLETYTFSDHGGKTNVHVEVQAEPEYKAMLQELWPKALKKLKALCEES